MRVKVEGLKFGFGAQDLNMGGCSVKEQRDLERNKQLEMNAELGSFEFELDVQEAIELAKLEGLTVKEVLSLVKDLGSMAIQAKAQKDESLREENRALREELTRIKEMVKNDIPDPRK